MSERIRQLEDALAILQSSVSQEPHPLLRDELLSLKVDKAAEVVDSDLSHDLPAGLDGLGTLSITDKGQRFFGASSGAAGRSMTKQMAQHRVTKIYGALQYSSTTLVEMTVL